jgi:hypothetical protein
MRQTVKKRKKFVKHNFRATFKESQYAVLQRITTTVNKDDNVSIRHEETMASM